MSVKALTRLSPVLKGSMQEDEQGNYLFIPDAATALQELPKYTPRLARFPEVAPDDLPEATMGRSPEGQTYDVWYRASDVAALFAGVEVRIKS